MWNESISLGDAMFHWNYLIQKSIGIFCDDLDRSWMTQHSLMLATVTCNYRTRLWAVAVRDMTWIAREKLVWNPGSAFPGSRDHPLGPCSVICVSIRLSRAIQNVYLQFDPEGSQLFNRSNSSEPSPQVGNLRNYATDFAPFPDRFPNHWQICDEIANYPNRFWILRLTKEGAVISSPLSSRNRTMTTAMNFLWCY